jgi:hypothetical protein
LFAEVSKKYKGQIVLKVPSPELFQKAKNINIQNMSVFKWLVDSNILPYLDAMIYSGGQKNKYYALVRGIPPV